MEVDVAAAKAEEEKQEMEEQRNVDLRLRAGDFGCGILRGLADSIGNDEAAETAAEHLYIFIPQLSSSCRSMFIA